MEYVFTPALTCFLSPWRGHHVARFLAGKGACTDPGMGESELAAAAQGKSGKRKSGNVVYDYEDPAVAGQAEDEDC
jgi:hypothetical protein